VTLTWYCSKHGTVRHSLVLQTRNGEVSGLNPREFTLCAVFSSSYRSVWAMSGYVEMKLGHPNHVKVTLVVTNLNLFILGGGGETEPNDLLNLSVVLSAQCKYQYLGLCDGCFLPKPFQFIFHQ
jgi:hypothetical protein